jgi:excisionase family DNA binding protein
MTAQAKTTSPSRHHPIVLRPALLATLFPTMTANTSNVEKLTYNTHETCEALGVSRATLWRLVKAGKITPLRTGLRKKLFSVETVRQFATAEAA